MQLNFWFIFWIFWVWGVVKVALIFGETFVDISQDIQSLLKTFGDQYFSRRLNTSQGITKGDDHLLAGATIIVGACWRHWEVFRSWLRPLRFEERPLLSSTSTIPQTGARPQISTIPQVGARPQISTIPQIGVHPGHQPFPKQELVHFPGKHPQNWAGCQLY